MNPLKLIITHNGNLRLKYGTKFPQLQKLFAKLIASDAKKQLTTKLVYVDDAASAKKFFFKKVTLATPKSCKDVFDKLYKKHQPAYMVIFGADDIFPFQQLYNELYDPSPEGDNDVNVPSDLPYACEAPFSTELKSFINATRVVGRIPDLPGVGDMVYVKRIIENIIKHKEADKAAYQNYFAITTVTWKASTQETLQNIFGDDKQLLNSPPVRKKNGFLKSQLKSLSHFYNCHGALLDPGFYGESKTGAQPDAIVSKDLTNKITYGTVVAAECCYGAQLIDPSIGFMSMANTYLYNDALSFIGSSTIAYGPEEGQALADLICQYFMKCVHNGASCGRALLEARQKFLSVSGETPDAYEMKTLAQFYILGDPSLSLVKSQETKSSMITVANRRLNLFAKGVGIGDAVVPASKIESSSKPKKKKELSGILKKEGFDKVKKEMVFETDAAKGNSNKLMKKFSGGTTRYRIFQKGKRKTGGINNIRVLVVKENDEQLLGWKVYVSR